MAMENPQKYKHYKEWLRSSAEEIIQNQNITDEKAKENIQEIIYELKVHEIELEMQNEELKKSQEALQISRSKFSDLYEYAPIAYLNITPHGLIKQVNFATVSLLGYDKRELIGKPLSVFIIEGNISKFFHHINIMPDMDKPIEFEISILTKNESQLHVWLHGSFIKQSYTENPEILLAMINITQRKEAEVAREKAQALERISRQSEEIYRNMFEKNSAVQILIEPVNGDIIKVNESACLFYGYSMDELKTLNISEISLTPHNRIKENIRLAYTGEKNNFIVKHRLSTGELRHMDIYTCVINYYGEELLYLILHDITDRINAEDNLKQSEGRYRNLLESISDRIYVIDHDLRIMVVNEAVCKFLNKSREELIGNRMDDVFPTISTYPVYEAIKRVLERGEPIVIEDCVKDSSQECNWYNVSIYPVPDGVLCITSDITLQKRSEMSLKLMNERLKKSNEELEQFAYIASHDLQEPIRMISNFSELLKQDFYDELSEEGRDYIDVISEGSERMAEIVSDLLDYSRIERRKKPFQDVDLNVVLKEAMSNIDLLIKNKEARITYDELPCVYADKVQLALVFQNLISNAIKFVKDKMPIVQISAYDKEDQHVISIKDNGIGISKEYHDKIFEIFKRLHSKDEYPGTGIGLSSCKKILERHRGDIWLESEPGKGSTFYFSIPKNHHGDLS
jgi:PAS domain S-box-containing protein